MEKGLRARRYKDFNISTFSCSKIL